MNWYFALSGASINRPGHDWRDLIRVALYSALQNTSLKPKFLFDGEPCDFTDEIRSSGAEVIFHQVKFVDALLAHDNGRHADIARGAFLRFDIPLIETEKLALYTDCDVMFLKEPVFEFAAKPEFFSATSQMSENIAEDLNSGVMLINIPAMRADYDALVAFTRQNLHVGLDQEILRSFYDGRYTPAARSLNWKPYWGVNSDAKVVHFHGPKPTIVKHLIGGGATEYIPWRVLYGAAPDAYKHYITLWDNFLSGYIRSNNANI